MAQLLRNRGISEDSQVKLFLSADKRLEIDPFLLPDMHQAVNKVKQALRAGKKIAIYGDADADGITATVLLVEGISALGGEVIPYIPHRLSEGYGLSVAALRKLQKQGVSLVITVDNGITAIDEVEEARKMGMDIIITDHHVQLSSLPPAEVIVNPKRNDSVYPFTGLAGVGVAFKFFQALLMDNGHDEMINRALDLVALGTVADMCPLVGENRYWVKRGLEVLNNTSRPGLQAMIRLAKLTPGTIGTRNISWALGPRLNAAGRLDDATIGYRVLLTEDTREADMLAAKLEEMNIERQRLTSELQDKVREKIVTTGADLPVLMSSDGDYPQGLMGLVAGRIVDEFYRPVILFRPGIETCRGSGRSISEFDLMAAFANCRDLLTKFGGHTRAAGFSLLTRNLSQFQERLFNLAQEQLVGLDLRPHINIDAEVPLSVFAGDTYEQVQQLAPFGFGNPLPTFVTRRVEVVEQRQVGKRNEHLKLKLKQEGVIWDVIGFNLGDYAQEIVPYLDIAYNLEKHRWNGNEWLRLNLLDFDPAD